MMIRLFEFRGIDRKPLSSRFRSGHGDAARMVRDWRAHRQR